LVTKPSRLFGASGKNLQGFCKRSNKQATMRQSASVRSQSEQVGWFPPRVLPDRASNPGRKPKEEKEI
jgi:hypothetical protein